MNTILWLSMINETSIKILWLIDIAILIILLTIEMISKRKIDDNENIMKNFKIGFFRCLGGITSIFLLISTIITISYGIDKMKEKQKEKVKENYLKCIEYQYIKGERVCTRYTEK